MSAYVPITSGRAARLLVAGLMLGSCTTDGPATTNTTGKIPAGTTIGANVEGDAFEKPLPQGINLPLAEGSFGVAGIVALKNVSTEPVELVRAELVRADPSITVRNIAVSPESSDVPISDRDAHVRGAVPIADAEPIPADGSFNIITFEMTLEPGTPEALLVGLDVHYRQGARELYQRWPIVVLLCGYPAGAPIPACDTYGGRPTSELDVDQVLEESG